MLATHGRNAGPLFVRIDRHGKLGRAGSGRVTADGRLTGEAVALIVNRTAKLAGLDPASVWTGHSLRRGFATEAHAHGASRLRIARHGGWDDDSRVLSGYIEDVDRKKDNPLTGIGL
jgi:integrase